MKPNENGSERPKSYNERRAQATARYQKLYARYRTHNYLDWGIYNDGPVEDMHGVPPYSERFDEFLGFWLGSGAPVDVPGTLERHFPSPDLMDLSYVEDVLAELEKVSAWKTEPYRSYKGSTIEFGPFLCRDYDANMVRARKWVEAARAKLARKDTVQPYGVATQKKTQHRKPASASIDKSLWDGLFLKGFTAGKLTDMLIALGLLIEGRQHVKEIKPRHWRAVIESLRDNKFLINTDAPRLHKALADEFPGGEGHLPKVRTWHDAFDPKNADVMKLQERASAWLKAN